MPNSEMYASKFPSAKYAICVGLNDPYVYALGTLLLSLAENAPKAFEACNILVY